MIAKQGINLLFHSFATVHYLNVKFVYFMCRQIQGIILMLVAQFVAQPLSDYDASLPQACPSDGEFEPQDWTSRFSVGCPNTCLC